MPDFQTTALIAGFGLIGGALAAIILAIVVVASIRGVQAAIVLRQMIRDSRPPHLKWYKVVRSWWRLFLDAGGKFTHVKTGTVIYWPGTAPKEDQP